MNKKIWKYVFFFALGITFGAIYLTIGSYYRVPCKECQNSGQYIHYKFEPSGEKFVAPGDKNKVDAPVEKK